MAFGGDGIMRDGIMRGGDEEWTEEEWEKNLGSFRVAGGYKVDGVVYEREREAKKALLLFKKDPKLSAEIVDIIFGDTWMTTKHYNDYCMPEPVGTPFQKRECVAEEIIRKVDVANVIQTAYDNDYPYEKVLPLIYYAIRNKTDTFEDQMMIGVMFVKLDDTYRRYLSLTHEKQRFDGPRPFREGMLGQYYEGVDIINAKMIDLSIKYNNRAVMRYIFKWAAWTDILNEYKEEIKKEGKMEKLVQNMIDKKQYTMMNILLNNAEPGDRDYIFYRHRVSWLLINEDFTNSQQKQILKGVIPVDKELSWDVVDLDERRYKYFGNVSINTDVFESVKSVSILKAWEQFILGMFKQQWGNIGNIVMIRGILNDLDESDETIRWIGIIILWWMCVEPSVYRTEIGNEMIEIIKNRYRNYQPDEAKVKYFEEQYRNFHTNFHYINP